MPKVRVNWTIEKEALNRAKRIVKDSPQFESVSSLVSFLLMHAGVIHSWSKIAGGILELAKKTGMDERKILELYIESLHLGVKEYR